MPKAGTACSEASETFSVSQSGGTLGGDLLGVPAISPMPPPSLLSSESRKSPLSSISSASVVALVMWKRPSVYVSASYGCQHRV